MYKYGLLVQKLHRSSNFIRFSVQLLPHLCKLLPLLRQFSRHVWEERQFATSPHNILSTSVFTPRGCQHPFPFQVAQEADDNRSGRAVFIRHRPRAQMYSLQLHLIYFDAQRFRNYFFSHIPPVYHSQASLLIQPTSSSAVYPG